MRQALADRYIWVRLGDQRLWLREGGDTLLACSVSTATKGAGEVRGSERTPRGWHSIRAKIGQGCPPNTVFVGRRPTGERFNRELQQRFPRRDWILTRVLWLSGLESGKNRGGEVDTLRRFIYIHGAPDDELMGVPESHGCIRMHAAELLALFDRVAVGTRVLITE